MSEGVAVPPQFKAVYLKVPALLQNTAVRALLILNDAPYGTERSYNGLRLALSLARVEGTSLRVFLMGDAIGCAKRDQKTPAGYYNVESMLKGLFARMSRSSWNLAQ